MKSIEIVLLVVFVVFCITGAILLFSNEKEAYLKFRETTDITNCSLVGPSDYPKEKITSQHTIEDTLLVEAEVNTYCLGVKISGDYATNKNNIVLLYSVEKVGELSKCMCVHKIEYELSNLPGKNFDVAIAELKK